MKIYLLLAIVIGVAATKDFYLDDLKLQDPGADGKNKFYDDKFRSGYVKVHWGDELYFLLFDSRSNPSVDPLLIWINGGPGCSSMIGAFTENGPYNLKYNKTYDPKFKFEKNEYSWNQKANVLYIDQPVGTGFSFVKKFFDRRTKEGEIAKDF